MILHGVSNEVLSILKIVFNNLMQHGYKPKDINIALDTPIPKKGEMKTVDDYRPISVSTAFATVYEILLLDELKIESLISQNQFGYRNFTSCKHPYSVVNETINYYVSLDASKALVQLVVK